MVTVKIRERCEAVGIKTAYQLQKAAQLAPSTASRFFKNDVTKLTLDALGKLCDALDCDAGVLFPRVSENTNNLRSKGRRPRSGNE
jgi:DNA-binding Xre family transcriptional regulator